MKPNAMSQSEKVTMTIISNPNAPGELELSHAAAEIQSIRVAAGHVFDI